MPKIKLKLAPQLPGQGIMSNGYALSGAAPDNWKANRKTPPIRLFPGNELELEVSHEHLTYLVGDRMVEVKVIDAGPKPIPPEEAAAPKRFDYPWEAAMARRKAEDPEYFAEQSRLNDIRVAEAARDEAAKNANKSGDEAKKK